MQEQHYKLNKNFQEYTLDSYFDSVADKTHFKHMLTNKRFSWMKYYNFTSLILFALTTITTLWQSKNNMHAFEDGKIIKIYAVEMPKIKTLKSK